MYYEIKHVTHFRYSKPISESVTEVYMKPRTEGNQRLFQFRLLTNPHARTFEHLDFLDNHVLSFDIPGQHEQLTITAEAVVELNAPPALPDSLSDDAWDTLDQVVSGGEFWDMLAPSARTRTETPLGELAFSLGARRDYDPLGLLHNINTAVYEAIEYTPNSTDVDSPIDVALESRQGVCQDFAHIMIALVRSIGIPCRYVSGYLFYHKDDRSTPDATHAWVEAYLPETGWIGFDPTNNVLAGERHIRVAIGRDYADVPPTRGVFKGSAESELTVEVHVTQTEAPFSAERLLSEVEWQQENLNLQAQQQQQQQ